MDIDLSSLATANSIDNVVLMADACLGMLP